MYSATSKFEKMEEERCIYCHKIIDGYYRKDWYGNSVCEKHYKHTQLCASCGRMTSEKDGLWVEESRFICNECLQNEVDENNIDDVVKQVIKLLSDYGFDDIIPDHFTCHLISASEMQQHIEGAVGVHIRNNCEWSEKGVSHLEQEILVLRHFSDIEFRSVLAHEMIHSWQTRNNLQEIYYSEGEELKHMKCEGFAQMGSWLVYSRAQNHITKQKKCPSKYLQQKISQMFENKDPYYGVAFKRIFEQFYSYDGDEKAKWRYIIKCARQDKLKIV